MVIPIIFFSTKRLKNSLLKLNYKNNEKKLIKKVVRVKKGITFATANGKSN